MWKIFNLFLYVLNWYPDIDVQVGDVAYRMLKISGKIEFVAQNERASGGIGHEKEEYLKKDPKK